MKYSLSRQTAQKIVETVKDVCGYNINFINTNGYIFASTDANRIGSFHEIGKRAIALGETIEVEASDHYMGTAPGVNIPITYNRETIAAIGISGNPAEVRKFAVLAQKITSLIIREQEADSINFGRKNWTGYILRSLVEGSELTMEQLSPFLQELHLDTSWLYRTVLIQLNPRINLSNIAMIENQIYNTFDQMEAPFYTFLFPNEYCLLLPEKQYQKSEHVLKRLAENDKEIIFMGIGSLQTIWKQNESYQAAKTAITSLSEGQSFALYDDLELEIILGCVSDSAKESFLQKTIHSLDQEDLAILQCYFDHDCSLKETSEALFLHKNTMQYKLDRIMKLSDHNPRKFRDAVNLYLALKLQQQLP